MVGDTVLASFQSQHAFLQLAELLGDGRKVCGNIINLWRNLALEEMNQQD
jgi:hypothetical protein